MVFAARTFALASTCITTKATARSCSSVSSSSTSSAAGRLIQRRATTGSVSSVFYLKTLNSSAQQQKQSAFMEKIFTGLVGLPIGILGLGGLYRMACEGKL